MRNALYCRLVCLLWILALMSCGGRPSGTASLTPVQAVTAAKAALVISYAPGDTPFNVTQNLTLPFAGRDGSIINWVSSNPGVVTAAGVVTQPLTADATATLTATIIVGTASDTKSFPITVKAQMTETQAVTAAKSSLAIGYAGSDSAANVTQNLTLPVTGIDGSTIAWASTNPGLVTTAGVVAQPLTMDAPATLTATIRVGAASDIKSFPITVKAQMTETQAVAAEKAALAIGYAGGDSASSITQNLALPVTGIDGSTITWASNNLSVVTTAGVVTQPLTADASATLTATITVGAASDTKSFPITVKAKMTDAEAVAAAKADLAIGYASGDSSSTVTQDLTLPVLGADACTISWSSSTPSAVSSSGTIARPLTVDLPVTLTATITSHASTDTKAFIVSVKAQMTDAQAVAAAKSALLIGYSIGDTASSVTQNVTLPLTGSSGCTVSWASSDASTVSSIGHVVQPAIGDAATTLTATIASNSVSDTVAFTLNVKGQMSDADAVAAAKAALNITFAPGDSAGSVTQNVTLAPSGSNGCMVTWASEDESLVSLAGLVTPPLNNDTNVNLTATINSHGVTDTKVFPLTVKAQMDDKAAIAADMAAIVIGFAPGNTALNVTGNLVLPTSGINGTTITWRSTDESIVSNSGGVTVPSDADAAVTMTATVSRGSANDSVSFPLKVKALLLSSWIDSSAISPGNGAIQVDPGIVIGIPFQKALDPSTVNDTTFQIINTSTQVSVPISVTYDAATHVVRLTPSSPLAEATQYSSVVAVSLKDVSEANLPIQMGFNFTTLSYAEILAQWKFNGNGDDSSGKSNVFNLNVGTYVTDVVHEGSGSLHLNGAGQYGTSDVKLGTALTVAAWVNVNNPIQPSLNTLMANTYTGESSDGFKLCINRWGLSDGSLVIEVGNGATGGKWVTAPGLIRPGQWYHLAFVIDQSNQVMKIYYNGLEAPLTFMSDEGYKQPQFSYVFNTAGPFTIGAFPGGPYGYKGHLDDMRVYTRVLTSQEIAKIAQENAQ